VRFARTEQRTAERSRLATGACSGRTRVGACSGTREPRRSTTIGGASTRSRFHAVAAKNIAPRGLVREERDRPSAVADGAYTVYGPAAWSGQLASPIKRRATVAVSLRLRADTANRLHDEATAAARAEGLSESSAAFAHAVEGHTAAQLETAFNRRWWSGVNTVLRLEAHRVWSPAARCLPPAAARLPPTDERTLQHRT
jgi:hypothetical protein